MKKKFTGILLISLCVFLGVTNSIATKATVKSDFSNESWMGEINDNKYLSEISIPGTHDTAALYEVVPSTATCQDLTLDEQLNIGVRYLDIRCRSLNDSFTIHHGAVYQNCNFDDVINSCMEFLKNNPTETIIMSVKEEYKPSGSTKSFEEIFKSYIDKNKDLWLLDNKMPTLGEARGKIVLLRRFSVKEEPMGIAASNWKDNARFDINGDVKIQIQDKYQVVNNEDKWSAIVDMYEDAKVSDKKALSLNYTSGYQSSILDIPNITNVSNYINPKVLDYFNSHNNNYINENGKNMKFGVSVMDFINEEMSTAIISTNFNEIVISKVNNLKSQNISKTSTELTWEKPDNTVGLVGYVIYKDGKALTEINKDTTKYRVEGLKENTIYGFKVTAKYSNGSESKPKSVNVRTTK